VIVGVAVVVLSEQPRTVNKNKRHHSPTLCKCDLTRLFRPEKGLCHTCHNEFSLPNA